MVSQVVGANCPEESDQPGAADAPGDHRYFQEVFEHYGLTGEGIAKKAEELV